MKKRILRLAVLSLVGAGAVAGGLHWYDHRFEESTDNAYVHGEITAIAPQVAGRVSSLLVHDNQSVSAGQVLVRLDDRDYRAQVAQAQAGVAAAQAAIQGIEKRLIAQQATIAEAEAGIATWTAEQSRSRRELARVNSLARNDYASRQKQDNARADAEKADAGLTQAKAKVESARSQVAVLEADRAAQQAALAQAKAALDLAQVNLDHTVITAPIAGVVGNRAVREGQYVGPGSLMMALVPLDAVWIDANYKETQITDMKPGQAVSITLDAYPDLKLTGRVQSFSPASGAQFSLLPPENASGNFTKIVQRVPVRISIDPQPDLAGKLRPGLSAIVAIDTHSTPSPQSESGSQLSQDPSTGAAQ
jgi:membrane fusion protein (multidrug efflux system)